MTAWRTISIALEADSTRLVAGMQTGEKAVANFGNSVTRNLDPAKLDKFGSDMTRNVTLPLMALGGVAGKAAADFESTFAKMVGLAGVPAAEVDHLRESILSLSGETAVAPQQLAEALYLAASSGLDAAQAMEATTIAAKGQAAGLGQAADLVGLVASAVKSYGADVIDAARATDILTATIREGRADPEELAGTLGRVLPLAAQLGITFDQVGGSVAYLSNVFGDTNRTVTAISGLFVKLLSPTKAGREALADMGTSAEALQAAISQDGLLGGLDLLREKGFAGNNQALRALFDDIEGYQAALALLNADQAELASTFEATAESAGSLEEALGEAMGTDAAQAKQAIVDLQVALVQLGQQILPIATDVMGFVGDLASAFSSLPEPMQKTILALAGIAAIAGPTAKGVAGVAKGVDLIQRAAQSGALTNFRLGLMGVSEAGAGASNKLGSLINRMGGMSTVGPLAGAALIGFGAILYGLEQNAQNAARRAAELENGIRSIADTAIATGRAVDDVFASETLSQWFGEHADLVAKFGLDASEMRDALTGTKAEFDAFVEGLFGADISVEEAGFLEPILLLRGQLLGARDAANAQQSAQDDLGVSADNAAGAVDGLTDSTEAGTSAAEDQAAAIDAVKGAFDSWQDAVESIAAAEGRLEDANRRVADAQAQVRDAAKAVADAQNGVRDAMEGVADAQTGVADAATELADAQREQAEGSQALHDAQDGVIDAERTLAEAQRESLTAQEALTRARETATERLERMREALADDYEIRQAQLAVDQARERSSDLGSDDEPATDLERRAAALAIEGAERRLADLLEERKEAEAALAEEQAKGVEGSEEVVAAKEAIEEAAGREKDAEEALAEAKDAVTLAQEDMARRVVEAQAQVAQAADQLRDAHDRVVEAQDRVVEAQQRVVDARQGVIDAHAEVEEAARGVAEAHLAAFLAEVALRKEMEENPGALRAYREDLEKLAAELAPDAPARKLLDELIAKIREAEGTHETNWVVNWEVGVTPGPWATGYVPASERRWGGIHETARWGRLPAHVTHQPTILYGERETGGEAMIPRIGDPTRSLGILQHAASWYGAEVVMPEERGRTSGMDPALFAAAVAASSSQAPALPAGLVQVHAPQHASPEYIGEMAGQKVAAKLAVTVPH